MKNLKRNSRIYQRPANGVYGPIISPNNAHGPLLPCRDCNERKQIRGLRSAQCSAMIATTIGLSRPENTTLRGIPVSALPNRLFKWSGKKSRSLLPRAFPIPLKMISWKCGSSCAGHGARNVRKWIADVGVNFYKLNSKEILEFSKNTHFVKLDRFW